MYLYSREPLLQFHRPLLPQRATFCSKKEHNNPSSLKHWLLSCIFIQPTVRLFWSQHLEPRCHHREPLSNSSCMCMCPVQIWNVQYEYLPIWALSFPKYTYGVPMHTLLYGWTVNNMHNGKIRILNILKQL